MLDQPYVTNIVQIVSCSSPAAFKDVAFTPALLLPVAWDASIWTDEKYQEGCEYGFFDYFEEMYQVGPSGLRDVFVERFYTWADVEREVVEGVARDVEDGIPLAWAIGFEHAWLSALALTDRALALQGLDLLVAVAGAMAYQLSCLQGAAPSVSAWPMQS